MNRCEHCKRATAVVEHGRVLFYRCALAEKWKFQTRCNRAGQWVAK